MCRLTLRPVIPLIETLRERPGRAHIRGQSHSTGWEPLADLLSYAALAPRSSLAAWRAAAPQCLCALLTCRAQKRLVAVEPGVSRQSDRWSPCHPRRATTRATTGRFSPPGVVPAVDKNLPFPAGLLHASNTSMARCATSSIRVTPTSSARSACVSSMQAKLMEFAQSLSQS